jgi:hypothetical protein
MLENFFEVKIISEGQCCNQVFCSKAINLPHFCVGMILLSPFCSTIIRVMRLSMGKITYSLSLEQPRYETS